MASISSIVFHSDPKRRVLTFTFAFILITSTIGIYIIHSISKINSAYLLTSEVQNSISLIHKNNLLKNDFIKTNHAENFVSDLEIARFQFDTTLTKVEFILKRQKSNSVFGNNHEQQVQQIIEEMNRYKSMFHKVLELYTEKYDPTTGYIIQMNNALQLIEQSTLSVNMIPIVNLKRNQKDFEKKRELRFSQNFQDESSIFLSDIELYSPLLPEEIILKDALLKNVKDYIFSFKKSVELEKEIGLTEKDGLQGGLISSFESIDGNLNQLKVVLEISSMNTAQTIKYSVAFLFLIIVLSLIFIVTYFIKRVYNPILVIQKSAEQIANGDLNINLDEIKGNSLLKNIVNTFGLMINKLELTLYQIEEIAKLNLNNKIELSSEKDIIGLSVSNVQKQLFKFTEDEKLTKIESEKRNWSTEGLAMFSNFLRGNGDLKNISKTIISHLVKYLNANQGGLYLINQDKEGKRYIELMACFAYERDKYVEKRIEIGEGLIGQCYLEKESIFMTDIPNDYLKITSGLGESNPRSLLIVPAKINDTVEAIIEIASFEIFEQHKISFIEKLAENIASTLWSIQVNEKTKRLLDESQIQTEEMMSKEEEMKQNIEELASIQEDLNRKEEFYQSKIAKLEDILRNIDPETYQKVSLQ